ncbi:lambda exonuclease family protein [Actinomycetaceae bacterium L2_0104]
MSLKIFEDLEQGSPEWLEARRGIITASVVGQLITPSTVKPAANDKSRALILSLAAERITGIIEPVFPNRDMERGTYEEPIIRGLYAEHYAPVKEIGFMTREVDGYRIGYSPDGLVGEDGLIEIKSRRQKKQMQTILTDKVPPENMAQLQCGLLVSGRKWIDYVSFCGGMPLYVKRVTPDKRWQDAILTAVEAFEEKASLIVEDFERLTAGMPDTEPTNFDLMEGMSW